LVIFVREATLIICDEGGFQQGADKAERSDCEPGRVPAPNCLLLRKRHLPTGGAQRSFSVALSGKAATKQNAAANRAVHVAI
jgi:hypothetical protein